MSDPAVRTHSVREVVSTDGVDWQCRGCGERWPRDLDPKALERQPCGVRS